MTQREIDQWWKDHEDNGWRDRYAQAPDRGTAGSDMQGARVAL